jgi:hypothetical protein
LAALLGDSAVLALKKIFLAFLKIGTFSFGGVYSMIAFFERELVDKRKWITPEEFVESFAIGQMTPGPPIVNTGICIGYKLRKLWGALAATVAAATTAAAASRTFLARTSLVDRQRPAFPILAIQAQDGGFGPFLGVHGGEGEAARATGVFIHNDVDFVHRAVLSQHVPQIVFGDVKGEVPDV